MIVRLRRSILDRWIVVNAQDDRVDAYGWSGSRWVPIDRDGLPAGSVQVSNFDKREAAAEYARNFGFQVAKET